MISIAGADGLFCTKLKQIISDNINSACKGIRLNQNFEEYLDGLREQAIKYGISAAKLRRIKYAYSLNSSGMSEKDFINYMKNRSVMFIQSYIDENQK